MYTKHQKKVNDIMLNRTNQIHEIAYDTKMSYESVRFILHQHFCILNVSMSPKSGLVLYTESLRYKIIIIIKLK